MSALQQSDPAGLDSAGPDPAGLAIIWHSRTGAAWAMAQAAHDGASIAGAKSVKPRMYRAEDVMPQDLLRHAGYLFVCPENLGGLTGMMKEAFDRCYYPLLGRIEGRPYATAIAAGTAGHGAQAQLDRIVTGWRLRRVAEGLIVNTNAQTAEAIAAPKLVDPDQLLACRNLGQALGEGLELGVF